jgi:hypothetical protein
VVNFSQLAQIPSMFDVTRTRTRRSPMFLHDFVADLNTPVAPRSPAARVDLESDRLQHHRIVVEEMLGDVAGQELSVEGIAMFVGEPGYRRP